MQPAQRHPDPDPAPVAPKPTVGHRADASGLPALCLLARLHHLGADAASLRHQLGKSPNEVFTTDDLLVAAQHLGLKAKRLASSAERLPLVPLPALARLRIDTGDGSAVERWVLLAQCDGQRVLFQDAAAADGGRPTIEPLATFAAQWSGELIVASSRASVAGDLARFDFSWFIPSLVKHRRLLGEVLLVSLFLQLFALVSPLFFQVVMDKVLVHRGLSTLNVLMVGLVVVVLFESLLTLLRSYVFTHTTSRIDVELGARLFRHLLALPLSYFQARRVGDSVARVRELENIRSFLTGSALTLVLDLLFSGVFIAVMLLYSVPLTLVVLASVPIYLGLSLSVVPLLRARLNEKFARGAENQALLVETLTGIQTVKASALEPALARRWDGQLAAYVSASLRTQTLANAAHEGVNLTAKLVNVATLWLGAQLVMDGALTVGMFVAFNMFAGRVAQPIMRLAQMWTDFQQTGIAMQRLGDILDTRTEVPPSSAAQLPALQGRITLDGVSFRYRPDAPLVLQGLSLEIAPGEVIGIVGRSGSGKSTLTKLIQRLHVPEQGRVKVDGIDIALIDAAQLRRQVGVVLQENWLFNRSIRDNIAIADPGAPLEAVLAVAQLAGAHEFISQLPEGYDTLVGEQGASLSGGQRQRIAIARALFGNPRILIFDEATSALDYESEAILQRHMAMICRGRTVIIIAHRLSSVRGAHRIIAMDQGRIVEAGSHEVLLRTDGLYAQLWRLQAGGPATGPATPAGQQEPRP
ncbi:type I secretion system ATPase [Leptothrix cholodnii SP-6]|uniref:Cyclolysin secretion/processing ATP-binding protein CyaB n=1 Tax=Leptothrix cholodnii (strain ATCC 51168 / LMG 8142 / SP-6) TaxID=395495 RepID=B1XZ90_LEPCP|nr:type I secretion system permease/ATPase [Leptothrix cholodnii]ACB35260.1 type I secretion system ATPase [Leptothrix cholodnii SP-6]